VSEDTHQTGEAGINFKGLLCESRRFPLLPQISMLSLAILLMIATIVIFPHFFDWD